MHRPLDELRAEHCLIERMLVVMDRLSVRLEGEPSRAAPVLKRVVCFMRSFVDARHQAKEEVGLFPLLSSMGATLESGPVRVLEADHVASRQLMEELDATLDRLGEGDPAARRGARATLTLYPRLMRRHIAREERIVFRLTETVITPADATRLAAAFREVDARFGPAARRRDEALLEAMERGTNDLTCPATLAS